MTPVTAGLSCARRRAFAAALAFAALFTLGCAAGSGSPPSAGPGTSGDGTALVVAEQLSAAGLGCDDVTSRPPGTHVADYVQCTIKGDEIIIRTFRSSDDRDRYLEGAQAFVDQMSLDVDGVPRIVGPSWVLTADTVAAAAAARAVLGGEQR